MAVYRPRPRPPRRAQVHRDSRGHSGVRQARAEDTTFAGSTQPAATVTLGLVNDKRIAATMIVCAALAALLVTAVGTALTNGERRELAPHMRAPSTTPVAFLRGVIRLLAANDYATAWTSLDPGQQRLVGRRSYVRCERLSAIPGRLDRIEALDAHTEQVIVPGSGARMRSTVVTFRLTFAPRPSQRPVVMRVRSHALHRRGRFAWMLPAKRLALHQSGQCGSALYAYPDV